MVWRDVQDVKSWQVLRDAHVLDALNAQDWADALELAGVAKGADMDSDIDHDGDGDGVGGSRRIGIGEGVRDVPIDAGGFEALVDELLARAT